MQIALTLVMAFSSIFVCDALCDVGIITFEQEHHHSDPEAHDHHGNQSGDHDHNQPAEDNHESSEADDCCEDLTTPFFDQLIKHKIENFEFNKIEKVDFIALYDGYSVFKLNNRKTQNSSLYYDLPPPLEDDQIRILYQSFLL